MRVRGPRLIVVVSAALLGAAISFPLGVIASHQFTDVPTSSTYHADIAAIRDAGITTGCGLNLYCPKDFVTREQMAAFLNRLGALGPGKTPVVNADKVDGHDASDFLEAGDIVIRQVGPWLPHTLVPPTINRYVGFDRVTPPAAEPGAAFVFLRLETPVSVGSRTYAFKSVEICRSTSVVTISFAQVTAAFPEGAVQMLAADGTDRLPGPPACYELTNPTPEAVTAGIFISLYMEYGGAGHIDLDEVTTTWTPLD